MPNLTAKVREFNKLAMSVASPKWFPAYQDPRIELQGGVATLQYMVATRDRTNPVAVRAAVTAEQVEALLSRLSRRDYRKPAKHLPKDMT
jgi:hypothetical protein